MMKRMGGFGSKRMAKKSRKNAKNAKKGGRGRGSGGGRVTDGRAPLRLPDLDLSQLAAGGPGAGPGLRRTARSGRSRRRSA